MHNKTKNKKARHNKKYNNNNYINNNGNNNNNVIMKDYFSITSLDTDVSEIVRLYHDRWYTEEGIKIIKNILNFDKTKTRKEEIVMQELYVCLSYFVLTKLLISLSIRIFQHTTNKNIVHTSFYTDIKSDYYKTDMTYAFNNTVKYIIPALLYSEKSEFKLTDNNGNEIRKLDNIPQKRNFMNINNINNLQTNTHINRIKIINIFNNHVKNKYTNYFKYDYSNYKDNFLSIHITRFYDDMLSIFNNNEYIRPDRHYSHIVLICRSTRYNDRKK